MACRTRSRTRLCVTEPGALSSNSSAKITFPILSQIFAVTLGLPNSTHAFLIRDVSPLSAASAASLRIADMRMMIDDEPRRRSSNDTLQALTVALMKPGRGACWNQARSAPCCTHVL
jgi:hypothetical protein